MANILPGGDLISPQTSINPSTGLEGKQKTPALPTENIGQIRYLDSLTTPGGEPMGLDPTNFSFHLKVGADNTELRAQDQPIGQELLYGAGRLLGTTATKFLEGFGYLYGLGEAVLTDKTLGESMSNGWTNFWGGAEETLKDVMPIYHTKKYTEGNVFEQMGTLGYWMDDAIDGVAFLASALIGSKGVSAVGKSTGAYSALAKSFTKATKMARAGKVASKELIPLKTLVGKADMITMSAVNSLVEAGFEAKDTMDSLIEQGLSKEEAAKAAQGTFLWNVGILMVPNYITNSMFFGKVNPLQGRIKNLFKDGKLVSEVSPLTKGQIAGRVAGSAAISVASEGAWEENIQQAIQDYFQKRAEGIDDRDQIIGIFNNWVKNWTTDEGQKAIALGAIIGLIPGGVEGYRKAKTDKSNEVILHSLLGHTMSAVSQDLEKKDVWMRGEDGKIVVDEKTKKPVADPFKLATMFVTSHYTNENAINTLVELSRGNQLMVDRLDEERVASLAFSHVGSADGLETFNAEMDQYARQKIESMQNKGEDVDENKVKELATEYKRKGQLYQTLFNNVQELFGGMYDFQDKQRTGNKDVDLNLYSLANRIKDNAILSQFMVSVDQMFWLDKAEEIEGEIASLAASPAGGTELGKAKIADLRKTVEAVKEQVKVSEGIAKSILKEDYWKDVYNKEKDKAVKKIKELQDENKPKETPTTKAEVIDYGIPKKYTINKKQSNMPMAPEISLDIVDLEASGIDPDGPFAKGVKKVSLLETRGFNNEGYAVGQIRIVTNEVAEVFEVKFKKDQVQGGTATATGKTVQEEEQAQQTENEVEDEGKDRKESLIEELNTRTSADEITTAESLASKYGDPVLSNRTLSELFMSVGTNGIVDVVYQGELGTLFIDPQTNEVLFKSNENDKETIIGKTTDAELYAGNISLIELGIVPIKHTVFDIQLAEDGVGIMVQGRNYVIDNEDPLSLIEHDEKGLPVAVTLKDKNGVPLRFTNPALVEELAYTVALLAEAREEAYKQYLNDLDSDFIVVRDPRRADDATKYYIYYNEDGSKEVVRPVVAEDPLNPKLARINYLRVTNPRFRQILIDAHMKDMHTLMERIVAERVALHNRETSEKVTEYKKKIKDEIKEFIRYSRSATEKEIVTAPGPSEISTSKPPKGTKTKAAVTNAKGSPIPGEPDSGAAKNEVTIVPPKKGKKKASEEEDLVDEKAEELSKTTKAKSKRNKVAEEDGIETVNEETEDSPKEDHQRGIAHPATGVAWKAEDNQELDKFLSDPETDLDGYTLVAEIDYDAENSNWTKAKQNPDYVKQHLRTILRDKYRNDNFDSLIDIIDVKLVMYDKKGKKLGYKGMYLHKSAFAEEQTVSVTATQQELWDTDRDAYYKSREKMVLEERKAIRDMRRAIIPALLAGEKVTFTNLSRGAGAMSQTPGVNRNMMQVMSSPDSGRFGISDRNNNIWDGNHNIIFGRSRGAGNVFWETTETVNGDIKIVKLNVAKVSEEHANILLKAYHQMANSKGGFATVYHGDEVTGDLTIGEVLSYLVLEGPITDQENKEKNMFRQGYLVPKHLRIEGKTLYFGTQSIDLSKKTISASDTKAFIDHITKQKNYNVPLVGSNTTIKTGLGGKIEKDFRIGSIEAKKGESYQSFLVRNGMVLTDLIKDEATGRIFSKPAFMFEFEIERKKAKAQKEVPEVEEEVVENKPTVTEVKNAEETAKAAEEVDYPRMNSVKDFAALPAGSEIFLWKKGLSVLNDDDSIAGDGGEYIHVIGVVGKSSSGQTIFMRSKKTDEAKQKKLEEFYGMEMSHQNMILLFKTFSGYPIHAEVPAVAVNAKEKALSGEDKDLKSFLDDIDGVESDEAPFAHAVRPGKYQAGDVQEAIKNIRRKLGTKFTLKIEDDLIRVAGKTGTTKAWGTFERDLITLSKRLEKGTEYHEAFHRVSMLYLDSKQRKAIYDEARGRYGIKDATDKEVNELLAEEYRKIEISKKEVKTKGSKITQFLRDLYDFIRTVITGKLHISKLDVDNLFRVMQKSEGRTGRLWYARPREESYNAMKTGDVYTHTVKGRDLDYVTSSAQLTDIVKQLVFVMVNKSGVIKSKDLSSLNYFSPKVNIEERIRRFTEESSKTTNQAKFNHLVELVGLYQEILDNYDIYLDLMRSQLSALGIRTILPENPEDSIREGNDEFARYDKASFEMDGKDNAGNAIKLVIATLRSSETRNDMEFSQFVDFDSMYETLQSELSELSTVEEMIEALKEKNSTPYLDLLSKLQKDFETDPFDTLRTQFFHAMRKNRYKFRNALASVKDHKVQVDIADAETQKMGNAQAVVWGQSFLLSEAFKDGKVDKFYMKGIINDFTKLVNRVKTEYRNEKNNKEFPHYEELVADLIAIFKKISVPLDMDVLNNMLARIDKNDKHAALFNLIVNSKMIPVFGNMGTFARLATEGFVKNKQGAEMLLDRIFANEQLFRNIAESFVEVHGGMKTNTILGPDGNPYYLYSENNYLTDLFHAIRTNADTSVGFNTLKDVEYNEHSYLLRQLIKPEVRSKVDVTVFSSLSVVKAFDRGRGYDEITDLEDNMVKMALFEGGYIVLPQLADRGHLYSISGLTPLKFNYRFTQNNAKLVLPDAIVDLFYGYVKDEYKQTIRVKEEIAKAIKKGTEHLLKPYYHFGYKEDGSRDYSKANGLKYQHFTNFNGKNYDFSDGGKDEIKGKALVRAVLEERINDGLDRFNKLGIVNISYDRFGKIASVTNKLFDENVVKKLSKEFGGNADIALRNRIANYTLNSIMATIEAEKIIFMSPAYYKNLDDKIKRYTAIGSTGTVSRLKFHKKILPGDRLIHNSDNFNSSTLSTQLYDAKNVRDYLHPKFVDSYLSRGFSKEEADAKATKALEKFVSVDPTDGQAYITPHMFRALHIRLGEWTQAKEDAFNLLFVDRKLTVKEQHQVDALFMQPLKFGYFGPQISPHKASPLYYKMSIATLTPKLVKGTQLQMLYDTMVDKDNPIDMMLFDSAIKVGVGEKVDYYTSEADGTVNTDLVNGVDLINMPTEKVSFKYLRRQTLTDPHQELRDVVKTQFRKVILSNIVDDRNYTINGKKVTGKQLKDNNKQLMEELSNRGVDQFLKVIGIDKTTLLTSDPDKLFSMIRTRARLSNMPDAFVDALALQADGSHFEPDAIPDRKWIQAALISELSKKTVDMELPGTSLIQMTNFGLRKTEEDDSLKLINEEGFMEAKVSIETFRNAIPNYHSLTYEQRLKHINDLFVGIGYRVPTQGLVSTVPLKIVGFLPETSTATIVLPSEFTALTGSDFDIDKLYFIRYNFKVIDNKPVKVKYLDDKNSTVEERFDVFSHNAIEKEARVIKKAWLTSLEELFGERDEARAEISRLKDETDFQMTDETDIDITSAEYMKYLGERRAAQLAIRKEGGVIQDINKLITQQREDLENQLEELRLDWKSDHTEEFINRSVLAQNITAAVENTLIDSYFSVLLSEEQIIDNYQPLDASTTLLKDLASEVADLEGKTRDYPSLYTASFMYQSEVKHKYLWGKKGIGPFARANVHHILGQIAGIHLGYYIGVGNTKEVDGVTVTDLSQMYGEDKESILDWLSALINAHVDIAKDPYIFNLNINNSTYSVGELLVRAGAGKNAFLFLAQPVLKDYAEANINYRGKIRSSSEKPLKKVRREYKKKLEYYKKIEAIKGNVVSEDNIFDEARLRKDIDIKNPETSAFYARQLQVLDKFEDLSKTGRFLFQAVEATQIDTKKYGNNLAELRRHNRLVNKVLEDDVIKNMQKVFDLTFIGAYYQNSVILGQSLFKDTTLMASDAVVALSDRIMEELGYENALTKEGLWTLNMVNDEIYAAVAGKFMANELKIDEEKLKGMFYGDQSMVARLNNLKNNPKYAENPLLKLLQPSMSFREGVPDIIITFTATDVKTKWAKDRIIEGWSELITSPDPKVAAFGKDLVPYAFFTSGGRKTLYSIYSFIPPAYLKDVGFSDYMKNMRNAFNDTTNYALLEGIHDDVYQNLWANDDIVPFVSYKELGQKRRPPLDSGWGEKYPVHISVSDRKGVEELARGYNQNGELIFKPYIKIEVSMSTQLYKFIGYITVDGEIEPVYEISPKKGYYERGMVIKEYGLLQSVIDDNKSKLAPASLRQDLIDGPVKGWKETEDGKRTPTYDFTGFVYIGPENMEVVTPLVEEPETEEEEVTAEEPNKENIEVASTDVTNTTMKVLGTIKVNLIKDLIFEGKAKTTIRNDSYHKDFYKGDGVYTAENNNKLVEIKHLGTVKKVKDEIKIVLKDKSIITESLDQFAADEGFDNWDNFVKKAKYSDNFISGEKGRQMYSIKPAEEQQKNMGAVEGQTPEMKEKVNDKYKHCK